MKITAMLLDGIAIVGYEVTNNKGVSKNLTVEKTEELAIKGKLDGVVLETVGDTKIMAGVDFTDMECRPLTQLEDVEEDGKGKYFGVLGKDRVEISAELVWELATCGFLSNYEAGLLCTNKGDKKLLKRL